MRIGSQLAALSIAVAVAIATSPVHAQSAAEADKAIAHGVELREKGKDEEALDEFRRAYSLQPSPKARAQMALAEQALGMWVLAEEHLREALRSVEDPFVAKHKAALTSALATIGQHLGSLEIRGEAPGAEVFIDGAKAGTLPFREPKRVEAGMRNLEVRSPGFYPVSRVVRVPAGETARETIELHAQRPNDTPSDKPPVPAAGSAPPERDHAWTTEPPRPREEGGGGGVRTIGWVFVGTSVALLSMGVVGQFVRQGQIASYNEDKSCPGQGSATQPPACADLVRTSQTWNTVSIVGFIGAGVFLSSGVVLVLVGGSPSSSHAKNATPSIMCGPTGCAGVF
ncbi:MAG: uncharacterized protein JWM74_2839 [Myxococcaceae bacterium]|nr:uncharacterized protein [Myxococcaceae bacterium]